MLGLPRLPARPWARADALLGAYLAATVACAGACGDSECVTGEEDGCVIASPCARLAAPCASGVARVTIIEPTTALPSGDDALAAPGDFLLENDRVRVVVDGLGHPHHLAPSGGAILDLTRVSSDVDALPQIAQATSLRAGEGVVYDRYRVFEGDGFAALQVRGHLEDDEAVHVSTRYELRACEGGIRVRTELTNGGASARTLSLGDAFFWGGHGHRPFVPVAGIGFEHGETDDDVVVVDAPFLATAAATPRAPAIGCVPCNAPRLSGFHRAEVSFVGLAGRDVGVGEKVVLERFVIVGDGPSVADVADLALDARDELFDEASVELRGTVSLVGAGALGDETRATVIVRDATTGTPWTQVTPASDGAFHARVPANADYVVGVQSFGRPASSIEVSATDDTMLGSLASGPAGTLTVNATLDGSPTRALVVLEPADDATAAMASGRQLGQSPTCAPLLGPPHAGTPACNRAVVRATGTSLVVPAGAWRVTAQVGPFATIARGRADVVAGGTSEVTLALTTLPLGGDDWLSMDLHAHGPGSFDSDADAAAMIGAAAAVGLDVLGFTDTDTVGAFDDAKVRANVGGRLTVLAGVESASLVPFDVVPGRPATTRGRYGFVPVDRIDSGPWRGAPLDEGTLPGVLFTRTEAAGFSTEDGLIAMLHAFDTPFLGRDRSFARAIGLDARRPLDDPDNATWSATPNGARFANDDYDAAEVFSGSALAQLPAYRALHHYLISENVVRIGLANGGAYGIGETIPGSPRTLLPRALVMGTSSAAIALAASEGAGIGTNGPIVEVSLVDADGVARSPSVTAVVPGVEPTIHVRVRAAPWVPVDEIRVIVNGAVAATLDAELSHPADPFGVDGLVRYEGDVALASMLPVEFGDAWVVVEAGHALVAAGDLDCDGIPDTGDNDGSGTIDARDVGVRAGPSTPSPPVTTIADVCLDSGGPLRAPFAPSAIDDPHHVFAAVAASPIVVGFSAILLDLDGGGYTGAPRGLRP